MKKEKIQSGLALFIAILALAISLWQGFEERRHNRLTVKPLLSFETISHNQTKSIRLSNNGLGPAIIKGFYVYLDGQKVDADIENPWLQVMNKRGLEGQISQMWYLAETSILKPEQSYILLSWPIEVRQDLQIQVAIEYESIYNKSFSLKEDF